MRARKQRPVGRRSTRLKGYDYASAGAYFVTIVTQHREPRFGRIVQGRMILSDVGRMVLAAITGVDAHYPDVHVDVYQIMPDHVHVIVVLRGTLSSRYESSRDDAVPRDPTPHDDVIPSFTLGDVVQRIKSLTTARYRHGVAAHGWPRFNRRLWQRDYYEIIIRDRRALNNIRRYILANPRNWIPPRRCFH